MFLIAFGSSHYDTYKVTEHDFLLGFIMLVAFLSSPFIYAYYRDKRERENRKRDKEIKTDANGIENNYDL